MKKDLLFNNKCCAMLSAKSLSSSNLKTSYIILSKIIHVAFWRYNMKAVGILNKQFYFLLKLYQFPIL